MFKMLRRRLWSVWRRLGVTSGEHPVVEEFREVTQSLLLTDVAIDCGANVGKYTCILAETGARVYAFEPNPTAFVELEKNTRQFPNVTRINAAVTIKSGRVKLHLHKDFEQDPLRTSTGSSLLGYKPNVLDDTFVEVDGIELAGFIADLGQPVRLLKMDIEGMEVDVLNHLLDERVHMLIDHVFVETHDRKIPELIKPTYRLRMRLHDMQVKHIRLDWQ